MRATRFILLLDPRYPVEREALQAIRAAPKREGAAFLRALMLMGFTEIKNDKSRSSINSVEVIEPGAEQDKTDETRTA